MLLILLGAAIASQSGAICTSPAVDKRALGREEAWMCPDVKTSCIPMGRGHAFSKSGGRFFCEVDGQRAGAEIGIAEKRLMIVHARDPGVDVLFYPSGRVRFVAVRDPVDRLPVGVWYFFSDDVELSRLTVVAFGNDHKVTAVRMFDRHLGDLFGTVVDEPKKKCRVSLRDKSGKEVLNEDCFSYAQ